MPSVSNLFPMDSASATPGPNDTQSLRALTPEGYELSVLVVANDPVVIESVRSTAPRTVTVVHSPRAGKLTAQVEQSQPSVLVYESADAGEVGSLAAQLTKKYPTVTLVVVGKREDGPQLMRLAAGGAICRFLLLPLVTGQTRLALMAALRQHVALKAAAANALPQPQGLQRKQLLLIAGCAVAAIAVAAGLFVGLRGSKHESVASDASTKSTVTSPLQARLERAQEALQQGRLVTPQDNNALELYRSVLAIDPGNEAARRGMRAIADKILESAEADLTREDLESAVRDIETVRDIEASHPRLAFFDTQIVRERERLKLAQMQDVSAPVQRLLAFATERIRTGRLLAPAGASARDALIEARRLDPTDPEVTAGVRELSAALIERGRRALGERDLAQARQFAQAAENLGSTSASVAALQRAIADISRQLSAREIASTPPSSAPTPSAGPNTDNAEAPAAAERDVRAAHTQEAALPTIAQALKLPRIREVQPVYPKDAARSGQEGWVEMEFIISQAGKPENIKVSNARPRRVFEQVATAALSQWRFEPVLRDGHAVEQRATLTMTFKLR